MRSKTLKAYIAVTQAFFPDLKIYAYNAKELRTEFQNKINYYQLKVVRLNELIAIRRERIFIYEKDFKNEINREAALHLREQIITDEMFIMETEADIAGYNYYQSVYIQQNIWFEKTQVEKSKEAENNYDAYINIAKAEIKNDKTPQHYKDLLQGHVNEKQRKFNSIAEANTAYGKLKDTLMQMGIKL